MIVSIGGVVGRVVGRVVARVAGAGDEVFAAGGRATYSFVFGGGGALTSFRWGSVRPMFTGSACLLPHPRATERTGFENCRGAEGKAMEKRCAECACMCLGVVDDKLPFWAELLA